MPWTSDDIPDQSGRTVVVTGANSGLGECAAAALAHAGASVVLACRTPERGERAAARMQGDVTVRRLDLADLGSVRAFAEQTSDVDVLINNAGVMAVPQARTADGFELQFGTNFLGHFALTGLLLPRVRDRVVTMSSVAHWFGTLTLDDLNWHRRRYAPWRAYAASKLADLQFALELARRLAAAGSPVSSVAAHPGYAATELQSHTESLMDAVMALGNRLVAQSAAAGAAPALYAATMPDVATGDFWGPRGPAELWGAPRRVAAHRRARDEATAAALWQRAGELTGVHFLDDTDVAR